MQVYKAAKYIRLSYTDDKSNESNSVGNQRKLIEGSPCKVFPVAAWS